MLSVVLSFVLCLVLVAPFQWFTVVGAKTFRREQMHDAGAALGGLAFVSGTMVILATGLFHILPLEHALPGALLAVLSIALYEWTRRTVRGRSFYIGLAGEVSDGVCDEGPYRYLRHPFYLSYLVAFAGMAIAVPTVVAAVVFALNVVLFVYMARDDERTLARSPLAAAYGAYKARTGVLLLLPRRVRFPPTVD
jgi:protein-S-isoprenylcysteine O-methyltransferase Ste14